MRATTLILPLLAVLLFSCHTNEKERVGEMNTNDLISNDYSDLVTLFNDWRSFEMPPKLEGAPDYRKATFKERMSDFNQLRARHAAIDTANWSIPNKVDWMIVWAEMNGFDFNHRVLKPWERDPAFYKTLSTYKSDMPAQEGHTKHGP